MSDGMWWATPEGWLRRAKYDWETSDRQTVAGGYCCRLDVETAVKGVACPLHGGVGSTPEVVAAHGLEAVGDGYFQEEIGVDTAVERGVTA